MEEVVGCCWDWDCCCWEGEEVCWDWEDMVARVVEGGGFAGFWLNAMVSESENFS